jgi:hypothetical protein
MYKVLQILEGTCETGLNPDDCRLVRNCISGFIYDSCPVDFTSDLGARLAVHPTTLKMSSPPKPFVWAANGIASSLDYVFLNRFESQRAEYWQTLYSTIVRALFSYYEMVERVSTLISYLIAFIYVFECRS